MTPLRLSGEVARRLVLEKQHLAARPADGTVAVAAGVADDLFGLHATVAWAPYLSLGARVAGFATDDLDRPLYRDRALVRIRAMRGTLFVFSRAALPFVYAATSRQCLMLTRRYLAASGVSDAEYEALCPRILDLVGVEPLTTAAIRRGLGEAAPVALSAVLYRMCDEALLARDAPAGGPRDNGWRYAPWEAIVGPLDPRAIPEDEAVAWLVERYVARYGPVTEADAAWWSGLPLRAVRAGVARVRERLVECYVEGSEAVHYLHAADVEAATVDRPPAPIRLLPGLDPYVMGFRARARYLDPAIAPFVVDRAGNIAASIVLDGRIVGIWDVDDRAGRLLYVALEEIGRAAERSIEEEAEVIGRLRLGRAPEVVRLESMDPLEVRPSGGFQAPLRRSG